MKPAGTPTSQRSIDEARRVLCAYFVQTIRGGSFRMRVRLHKPLGAAWFYEHHDNTWHKQDFALEDTGLVQAVTEELALLATQSHGDVVHVTQHTAADWHEIDIQFVRVAVERNLDKKLDAYIAGVLFGDRHDSHQDMRRQMHQTPRQGLPPR